MAGSERARCAHPPSRVERHAGLAATAAEWDSLADAIGAGPFVRPGWFEAWVDAFGGEPVVYTARRGGELVGAIPVLHRRQRLTSPTNWHTPYFGPVCADRGAARDLARALVERAPSVLDLWFLDPIDPFLRECSDAAGARGRWLLEQSLLRSPYIELSGDFESFEAGRTTKFRRETRRRERKLAEEGTIRTSFDDGRVGLAAQLDEGFAVEGSGWKTEEGTSIASRPETDRFYRAVADWAASRGWLQLGFLRLDGRAVAFQYSLVCAGAVHVVKVGFDPAYRRFAPGTILTRAAIQRAFDQTLSKYDFLGADDPYKLDWTDAVRERVRLQAFRSTALGLAGLLEWGYGRPAAKRLRERAGAALTARRARS